MRSFFVLIAFCFAAAIVIREAGTGHEPLAQPLPAKLADTAPHLPLPRPDSTAPLPEKVTLPAATEIAQRAIIPETQKAPSVPVTKVARPEPAPARAKSPPLAKAIPQQQPQQSDTPCTDLLAEDIATVQLSASVSGNSGDAVCGDEAPARMSAVKLRDGGTVQLNPPVLSGCGMALEFARWVRDDLAAAARHAGSALRRINIASSYSCRPVNNIKGQKLSEHGRANAVDIGSLVLANGKTFAIFSADAPAILLATMRASACERFTTVLGPGADAAHADHIHVDLAQRRGGYRICQWNMPAWPLP